MTNPATIAVTGGTGHLGVNLINQLLNQDFHVRALIRHTSYPIIHENLTWIEGDLNNLTLYVNTLSNC